MNKQALHETCQHMFNLVLNYKYNKEGVPSYLLEVSETPESLNVLTGGQWFQVWDKAKELVMRKGYI
ncbi:hypothetical protein FCMLKIFP_00045 [Pseudomonas phage Ka3]|nr:hypothetical protein FCMLKIFP_00045 [Pseudomonas phage Ka3]